MGDIITRIHRTLLGLPKAKEREPPERRSDVKVLTWEHLETHKLRRSNSGDKSNSNNDGGGGGKHRSSNAARTKPRKSTSSQSRNGRVEAGGRTKRPPTYGDERRSAANMV